ncbi:DUF5667 domain-containing protein [Terrabacter sp. NPDC080008]|uniref:DUF5667 domain-containing protein n=1 Tax=Terrabacter sp. NPDC080008 TaxID=3155176 RepID=UPI003450A97A
MDLGANADGQLLQRALEGGDVSEPGILELVAVLHAVQAVDQAGLAPRAEFVSDLRARLLADDPAADGPTAAVLTLPPATPDSHHGTEADPKAGDESRGGTVSVLRVAARPLKLLAAVAAGILVVGGALGAASRSAVPGDALYGVKQLLDRAAVQLAGSRYDEGLTYLAQAQEHISDARDLLDQGSPSAHDLDTAYDSATDAVGRAQTILVEVYRTESRPEALSQLADFYARAIPQVDAMRPRVPTGSLPAWQRLRDALGSGDAATLHELASCATCGDRAAQARDALAGLRGSARPGTRTSGTPAPPTTAGAGAGPASPGSSAPAATSARPPAATTTAPDGLPVPGGSGAGAVPVPGGAVNLPTVGVGTSSVGVGGGGLTVPGATVSLPGVGVTSSTIGVGGGGVTLPGATIPVPSVTLSVPKLPTGLLPTTLPTTLLPTQLLP